MNIKNEQVNTFIHRQDLWKAEFESLRDILLNCEVVEEYKWGVPCYTYNTHNVVLMHGFKNYCALLFVKGALLRDEQNLLVSQTENTQSSRHLRFTSLDDIVAIQSTIKKYIEEAIENEKQGKKIELKETSDFEIAQEFQSILDERDDVKKAFYSLTPGRQRAYLLYFSSPKQSKTRSSRVENYIEKILNGKGLHDE